MKNSINVGKKMGRLEWQARFVVGKLRSNASLTRKDRLNCLGNIGRRMEAFGVQCIKHIKPKHVMRYFAELKDNGLSAGRIANHATAMRMLCTMMGKRDIVPSNRVLGCTRDDGNRTKYADVRMDMEKAATVRAQLSSNHQIAYDLARHFGLRQKECLLSHQVVSRDGCDYLVVEGAKGGRPRQVPVVTQQQREVLQRNADYRAAHGGKLIDGDKSLKQGLKMLQNELADAGATRDSRANMHALRREYVIEQCLGIIAAQQEERSQQGSKLADSIGHGRSEVLRAYSKLLDDDGDNDDD